MISSTSPHIQIKDGSQPSDIAENKQLQTAFKTIQKTALSSGINLDNAIDFVEGLSEEGKAVLKRFHGLYDDISTENMSKEGAYNLLQNPAKRADLNGDGIINIGSEVSVAFPPVLTKSIPMRSTKCGKRVRVRRSFTVSAPRSSNLSLQAV